MPDDLERTRRRGSADSFTSSIGSQAASQASSPKRKEREREEEGEAEDREPATKKQKSEPPSEASQ